MTTDEPPCIFCVAEFPHEHATAVEPIRGQAESTDTGDPSGKNPVGRPKKVSGEEMEDPISTGRKRAKLEAPIEVGLVCEWAFLRNAGGGVAPIKGCLGNPATDRHHGPDKSTLNNTLGENLHRICAYCHNRWHAANDKFYKEPRPADNSEWVPETLEWRPHDPNTKLTKKEALEVELARTK